MNLQHKGIDMDNDKQLDISGLNVMVKNNKERLDKLDVILDKVRNRPPVWMTFMFAGLTLVIGWLIK